MIESALDMLLMHYAAGTLDAAESLMAAAHLALRPDARHKVSLFEALGGRMMADMPMVTVSDECLSAVLAIIDQPAAPAQQTLKSCIEKGLAKTKLCLPDDIHALIDAHCTDFALAWMGADEGLEIIELRICTPVPCNRKLNLLRLQPHRAAPRHSHEGLEITVVLGGSYSDGQGRYTAGDIIIIDDPSILHTPMADEDGCLCLTLTDGSIHLKAA